MTVKISVTKWWFSSDKKLEPAVSKKQTFVLAAAFVKNQSVFWNMEKRLKHWKKICLLNLMQKEGKLHSAAKLS